MRDHQPVDLSVVVEEGRHSMRLAVEPARAVLVQFPQADVIDAHSGARKQPAHGDHRPDAGHLGDLVLSDAPQLVE